MYNENIRYVDIYIYNWMIMMRKRFRSLANIALNLCAFCVCVCVYIKRIKNLFLEFYPPSFERFIFEFGGG